MDSWPYCPHQQNKIPPYPPAIFNGAFSGGRVRLIYIVGHSVKKQVQLHFSCTAVSSEDSSATDL